MTTPASKKEKVAIILTGGGMRSAHGAGFLYGLGTHLGINTPDIIIGSSGNAGNALYYSAGQFDSLKRVWTELLPHSRFISILRFWRMMDVDFLIDDILRKKEPLNIEKLKGSPIEWCVALSEYDTGHIRYICKEEHAEPLELLRAAKAIPLLYGRKISLWGKRYMDGEIGARLIDHVEQARRMGATKILVVNDARDTSRARAFLMKSYASLTPEHMKESIVRDLNTATTCISLDGVEITCVFPHELPADTATKNEHRLVRTFTKGVQDALAIEGELRSLFNTTV